MIRNSENEDVAIFVDNNRRNVLLEISHQEFVASEKRLYFFYSL